MNESSDHNLREAECCAHCKHNRFSQSTGSAACEFFPGLYWDNTDICDRFERREEG